MIADADDREGAGLTAPDMQKPARIAFLEDDRVCRGVRAD